MRNCGYVAVKQAGDWCHEKIEWGNLVYSRKSENIPEEVTASWDLKFQTTLNLHRSVSMCVCAQSCLTLCKPLDCSPPASLVHGIFQPRILEWFAIPFSRIFLTQESNLNLLHCRQILYRWATGESQHTGEGRVIASRESIYTAYTQQPFDGRRNGA